MTDNDIIKALECCKSRECSECSRLYNSCPDERECRLDLMEKVYNLINRQQAEIERLTTLCTEQNEELDRLQKVRANILKVMKENISQTKSEAIKEFAERFKEKAGSIVTSCQGYEIYETKQYQISAVDFDNLVKEMTEVNENG